ncbi:hypothetical protein [Serratia nematodiphila]|uniref:hypothetical protein n=1 Tax=Serratia nematodiphila TaxID=458197 RepID=UPI0011D51D22|nr:hypothetical protein [Serratia nematodiphila]TXE56383.1 hypothetical protein FOT58_21135 [Serratia nematodiphila]
MTEVLTYEALKEKCVRLEQINDQTLQVKLTMAETIKELTDRVNALAVENAEMREALDSIRIYSSDTLSGPSDSVPDMAAWLREGVEHLHQVSTIETPATDTALAAIHAQGVEKFVTKIAKQLREAGGERGYNLVDWCEYADHLEDRGEKFAAELREAK